MVKRILRGVAKVLDALVLLLILFLVEEHVRGRMELNAYRKELQAKGEKLTLAELGLPPKIRRGNGT